MKDVIKETLAFTDLTPEEKEKRGILGRLYGPCADIKAPTRNGRFYNDELWENVFNKNEIVKELLANGGIPGEAQHPADRTEVDAEKIAIMMPEAPKKDDKGHLIAYFDILDTPCGRIVYQLAKYGFKLGVSSRGTGDVYDDEDGNETVDPETYDFSCFDTVIIPAVEDARMSLVTESLDKDMLNLKKALNESLVKATPGDRKLMEETLNDLHIDYTQDKNLDDNKLQESETPKQTKDEPKEAINDGSEELIKSLQESLKDKAELEALVKSLQEKLAVSDTKVNRLNEELTKNKNAIVRLTSLAQKSSQVSKKVSTLEEELKVKEQTIEKLSNRNSRLIEQRNKSHGNSKSLNESISKKDDELKKLNESLVSQKETYEGKIKVLNEKLEKATTDSQKEISELTNKVSKSNKLCEGYKKLANNTVDRYIKSKALMLGVSDTEIKNKLKDSYTLDDVDTICEDLQSYELNISRLPFSVNKKVKVKVNEEKKPGVSLTKELDDDDIDDNLLRMAGM